MLWDREASRVPDTGTSGPQAAIRLRILAVSVRPQASTGGAERRGTRSEHTAQRGITMADTTTTATRQAGKRGPTAGTAEARRGGEAVRAKYGKEFFSKIGKKGGDTVRREHGSEFYAEIGRKGGETTKARQGADFYARIGKKGGLAESKR